MTVVSGPLVNVTTAASSVRDVQVHTKKVRAWGDGLMTPDPSQATLSNGVVSFEAAPGPVVMVLFMAEAGAETVSLVVGEGTSQSLADAYRDGQMAGERDSDELAEILEQIRGSVGASAEARAGAEAAAGSAAGSAVSAGRDADRAEAAAGDAATEAAGLAADAVRLEVKGDADRSAAGATTATEKAAEAAGSATRAEEAEAGAVEAEEGAVAGQELSEDAAAVSVAAAIGVQAAFHQYTGTGFPEGKVTAPVGATYTDTAATAGAVRWIKTTGTGATGWVVEYGNTGWRRLAPVGQYFTGEGGIFFRRRADHVTIRFADVGVSMGETVSNVYLTDTYYIPAGFRVGYTDRPSFWVSNNNANPNYLITIAQGSRLRYQSSSVGTARPGTGSLAMQGQGSWVTDDPWPASLPGTPG